MGKLVSKTMRQNKDPFLLGLNDTGIVFGKLLILQISKHRNTLRKVHKFTQSTNIQPGDVDVNTCSDTQCSDRRINNSYHVNSSIFRDLSMDMMFLSDQERFSAGPEGSE